MTSLSDHLGIILGCVPILALILANYLTFKGIKADDAEWERQKRRLQGLNQKHFTNRPSPMLLAGSAAAMPALSASALLVQNPGDVQWIG